MTGIVNINKPYGKSSHFVVAVVRRVTGIKKVGHTGTLDPLATGVLPICIGRESTKLSQKIMDGTKCYRAVLQLGITTTTQDSEGEIISQKDVNVSLDDITEAVNSFVGQISQIPPMYSAVKINGQKLYKLAREGKEVEREPRKINIYSIEILNTDLNLNQIELNISCSKGTYIRTLCNDIGEKLGCGGYMASLVRTKSSCFCIENSFTLDEFEQMWKNGEYEKVLIPPETFIEE
ncbi:MAG: tRNA pseudouridine(55) synthase TruB [Clostridia bacterium]|nr:tRNA pseudouridine(55) synthase TruB [Clostridia bacterium]